METPMKIDDLGVSLFSETSISSHWGDWYTCVFSEPYRTNAGYPAELDLIEKMLGKENHILSNGGQ